MNKRIIAIGVALLSAGCSTLYTSSFDRDERPEPQDAFIYGSFWVFGDDGNSMTMGIVLDCRDGKRYVLRFLKHNPIQVFKVSPSTCTPTGTVFTFGEVKDAEVRPMPSWRNSELVFAPGKAYYIGDFTGSVVSHLLIRSGRTYNTKYTELRGSGGWKLEKNEDKYQATTREFRAAYPKLAGVPTESQMIERLTDEESRYAKACDAGDAKSCIELGVLFEEGRGASKDDARAAALFTKACDRGEAQGCFNLGVLFDQGRGVDKDEARAAALFTKACDDGGAKVCFDLGVLFEKGIGVLFKKSRGVSKDDARAAALFTKACDRGEAQGCFNLGVLFDQGRGVSKDDARAAALFTKACDAGDAVGCFNLGVLFDQGRGVGKDEARAAALYTRACDAGKSGGCYNLGRFFEQGRGVPRDSARAAALFAKACDIDAVADSCDRALAASKRP